MATVTADWIDPDEEITRLQERCQDLRARIPPARHLRKARDRLVRLYDATDIDALGAGKAHIPPFEERREFVEVLQLVLRDYERMLDALLPPSRDT